MKRKRSHSRRHWRLWQPKAIICPHGIIWHLGRLPQVPPLIQILRKAITGCELVTSTEDGVMYTHTFTLFPRSKLKGGIDLSGGRDYTTVTIVNNGVADD